MERGHRLANNFIKVQSNKGIQFRLTLPKSIAIQSNLKQGSILEFEYFNLMEIKGLSIQNKLFEIMKKEKLQGIIIVTLFKN